MNMFQPRQQKGRNYDSEDEDPTVRYERQLNCGVTRKSRANSRFAYDRPLGHLPFDVWSEIVLYIRRQDLARLCIVSSAFLSLFRPFLYRVVVFDGSCSWIPTLDLLAGDKSLANAVVQLDFLQRCHPNPEKRPIVNLVAIANLTSLRRFRFSGGLFRNEAEEDQFWRILFFKIPTSLEQLMYQPGIRDLPPLCCGNQYGGLGGLKIVEWNPRITENLDPLWSVLSKSHQTLTSLSLPAPAFGDHEYPRLANLHFPNLRVLTIRSGTSVQTSPPRSTHMTNFVLVHDTIEELCVSSVVPFDAALLNVNSLPRIRVFSGFLSQFNVMMSAQLTSLSTTLHRLTVSPDISVGDIDNMFPPVRSSRGDPTPTQGRLPMLQQIRFSCLLMDIPRLEQIISGCAESFGSTLEVLHVDIRRKELESGLLSALVSLFGPFKRLRVVTFSLINSDYKSYYVLSSEERAQLLRFALPFVQGSFEQCGSLREVRVIMSEVQHSWLVARTPDDRGEHCPSDDCTGHLLYVPTRHRPPVMA